MKKAVLLLEDGSKFEGYGIGKQDETIGEIVFNTAMTGYQEILTDPSYKGQIVTFTYPHIGNYGVNDDDIESSGIQAEGMIIGELSNIASNFRSKTDLNSYLIRNNVTGITGIDTRAVTRKLRIYGTMKGIISCSDKNIRSLNNKLIQHPDIAGQDLAKKVTCEESYYFGKTGKRLKVVAFDFGMKTNILRMLEARDCSIFVVPASTGLKDILVKKPDGIFLSNGPGDPEGVSYAISIIKDLIDYNKKEKRLPIFGICLGHQLLALASGLTTYKLKFGHHGANHPVMDLRTRVIEITSQNHNFCVRDNSIPSHIEKTHVNLNDNTCEGLKYKKLPIYSVQYHPEAAPGPHDSNYIFNDFIRMMEKNAKKKRH